MKEKYFKELGLDDDNGKMKKLETKYNLDDLFSNIFSDENKKYEENKNKQ